jgi:glycosyltransferase involved in cell wall biosynthesis
MEATTPMNLRSPVVSIVTPSYNQGRYIERTLRSIRDQRYPLVEHIVVDGESTDGTVQILRHYERTYNLLWISETDSGMYEAINKGMRLATGDIVAYLNSDDHYFPWTVEVAVRALLSRPDAAFIYGDMVNVDDAAADATVFFYPPFRLNHLRRWGFLGQPTVFWRRGAMDEAGPFDESLRFIGDCDYWIRLGERHRGLKVDEILAVEHNHPQAKRMSQSEALMTEIQALRERYMPRKKLARQASTSWERLYAGFWRRANLMSFLVWSARLNRFGATPKHWKEFLSSGITQSLNFRSALLSLVPFTGGRFARGLLRLEESTPSPHLHPSHEDHRNARGRAVGPLER